MCLSTQLVLSCLCTALRHIIRDRAPNRRAAQSDAGIARVLTIIGAEVRTEHTIRQRVHSSVLPKDGLLELRVNDRRERLWIEGRFSGIMDS